MRLSALILTSATLLGFAGCGGGDEPEPAADAKPSAATVEIRTFAFQPDPITVSAGTPVTFVNHDTIGHTVTSGSRAEPDGRIDEKLGPANGKPTTATVSFPEPGRYAYFCSIHPGAGMTAAVNVE